MSIFFEFDVGSKGRRLRRAIDDDKKDIELILKGQKKGLLFDDVDIGSLIELSTLSLCMIDDTNQVVGFIALCDHPNIPAVDPADWENWIRNMYQKFYLSRNTLFIHFMCCVTEYEDVFLEEALVSVFRNDVYLNRIVLIVPLTCPPGELTKHRLFKRGAALKVPAKFIESDNAVLPFLYEFRRKKIYPKLLIRRAVQEDNDDVVEILDRLSPQLKEQYGNFYISEIVGFHPESQRKILVAEVRDKAVGVICLNSEVNYTMLQNNYELRAFHGLKKASPLEQEKAKRANFLLKQFGEPIIRGSISPFTNIKDIIEEEGSTAFRSRQRRSKNGIRKPKSRSKVSFQEKVKLRKFAESEMHRKSPQTLNRTLNQSLMSLYDVEEYLDGDPFDYEIVNIDLDLLQVPEMFSSLDLNNDSRSFLDDPKTKKKFKRRLSKINSEVDRQRKRRASRAIAQDLMSPPKEDELYGGEPNAFIIELFGLEDDLHESHGFEFLEAAFEMMSSCEYCIIRAPSTDYNSLLQHFTYVPHKPQTCTEYALYVAQRNSVRGRLRVRKAEFVDIPLITQLLQHKEEHKILCAVQCGIQNDKDYQSFVLYCGLNLVGLAVLHETEHLEFTRVSYNLDPYHKHQYHRRGQDLHEGFTTLHSMVVYSAFQPHFRFFAREVLRLSGCNSLLWLAARRVKLGLHRFNNIAEVMVPVMPRNCCSYYEEIVELRKLQNISKNTAPFMVWFLNKKISSLAKVTIDTRIVVIGASRTAIAFLNTLLFSEACPYLTFNSVTLVSPHGLPYAKKTHPNAEMMFPKFSNTTQFNLKCVPYQYYVNVIEETMVGINKKDKCITLSNGSKYYYDLLFLLFGKQYQHPDYMKPLREHAEDSRTNKPLQHLPLNFQNYLEKQPYSINCQTPANVFIINDIHDANKALWYINGLYWDNPNYKILVYGASIHAYCCLATLLSMGIQPDSIVFIEPFPPENPRKTRIPIFSNVYVNRSVHEILNDCRITVYKGYYFQNWTLGSEPQSNLASHVEFLSHFHMIKLECSAFFYYGKQEVNEDAFIAINKSGLAYNAGILIDHEFRTKDPSILAAGPCTRYYSRYFAEDKRQKYYDSYEIGEKLGSHVRNQLDPIFCPKNMKSKRQTVSFAKKKSSILFAGDAKNQTDSLLDGIQKWRDSREKTPVWKLPDLRMPLVTHCTLPGGLQYLDVRSPGLKTPHPYLQSLTHNGIVMETFQQGYFKLHCTNDFTVDGVTCLTPNKRTIEKFKNLYGFSSAVLNHVCLKFATNKIDDFFEFFNMPWAQFLYYEQVYELLTMVQELYPQGIENRQTLREGLIAKSDELSTSASSFRTSMCTQLRSNFEKSPYIEAITNYVLEWLSENDILLPLYFQKWHNAEFQVGTDNCEAFRRPIETENKL